MGSNDYRVNPYLSFPVPPPNFNSNNTGMNQNWKTVPYQQQSSAHSNNSVPTNYDVQKFTPPPTMNAAYNLMDKIPTNNAAALQNIKSRDNVPATLTTSNLMALPPPPPPPYMPGSSNSQMATGSNYYMTGAQPHVHAANRYSPAGLSFTPPTVFSPVTESFSSCSSSFYTPPPRVASPGRITHYQNNTPQGYCNNFYKKQNESEMDSPRMNYNKRRNDDENDSQRKNNKKRKKPLSQNIPQKKDWSVKDAIMAIQVEKDYNKRNRCQSLIIKFPDVDLNRDIVSAFHPAIDNVHFQQPSTPKFCCVTLKENTNAEAVIKRLNKTRFGHGLLTAEYKTDREDEMNIGPEDIDPLTLCVGNLAQDVIKEDMVRIYPKHERMYIGYAKKMKTRYAYVFFKCVSDSIEAFKQTHATQLYNKSLIVRFRRLHGTVGMPGEPKPQLPQKNDSLSSPSPSNHEEMSDSNSNQPDEPTLPPWKMVDVSTWDRDFSVKREPVDYFFDDDLDDLDSINRKSPVPLFPTNELEGVEEEFPQPQKIKEEIKGEFADGTDGTIIDLVANSTTSTNNIVEKILESVIKEEPEEKKLSTYKQLILLNSAIRRPPPVKVKKEKPDSPLESTDSPPKSTYSPLEFTDSKANSKVTKVEIKKEHDLYGDDSDDGAGASSGDDVDFSTILTILKQTKNKKKRLKNEL